jgi:DNA-directed RNA polymerase subunit RPC12/RpoP
MSTEGPPKPFAALDAGPQWAFDLNCDPLCPHCGVEILVGDHALERLYEETRTVPPHGVECPECGLPFLVETHTIFVFSTSYQRRDR